MAEVFDIMLDDGFDLLVKDGDFAVGESTKQHQKCLLIAEPGQYKQSPTMGAGVYSFMNDDESAEAIKKAIQKHFEADGMIITHLNISSPTNIDIEANY